MAVEETGDEIRFAFALVNDSRCQYGLAYPSLMLIVNCDERTDLHQVSRTSRRQDRSEYQRVPNA